MKKSSETLIRMMEACGAETDGALAAFIGIPRATVASWRHRGSVPQNYAVQFASKAGVNLHWLLTGEGGTLATESEMSLHSQILAISIELAQSWAKARGYKNVSCAELSNVIAHNYLNEFRLYLEFLKAGRLSEEQSVQALRRARGMSRSPKLIAWWESD